MRFEPALKIKLYFGGNEKEKIVERLDAANITGKFTSYAGRGGFKTSKKLYPGDIYFTLTSTVQPLPEVLHGIRPSIVYLYDCLPQEQNLDIKPTCEESGNGLDYEVTFGEEKFVAAQHAARTSVGYARDEHHAEAFGYRSVIRIKIFGKSLRAVKKCYRKIMDGKTSRKYASVQSPIIVSMAKQKIKSDDQQQAKKKNPSASSGSGEKKATKKKLKEKTAVA